MESSIKQISDLINSKTKCIWINSYEEDKVLKDLSIMSVRLKNVMDLYDFSIASGIRKIGVNNITKFFPKTLNVFFEDLYKLTQGFIDLDEDDDFLGEADLDNNINYASKNNIFVLKDFHNVISNAEIMRKFRDIVETPYRSYNTIIVLSPIVDIPIECQKLFTVIDYDYPNEEYLNMFIDAFVKSENAKPIEDNQKNDIIKACKGLTVNEIVSIFRLSIEKKGYISINIINEYKIDLIKKTDILEYRVPSVDIEDIGGNHVFKRWIKECIASMSEEAKEFGCKAPKGYLALGVPGSAKTMFAEALAKNMNVPFLKLDMSKIMDSKVGNTEKNIALAIRMVKSCAPCVFLVDEVEKTLSGLASSNKSDGGTMSRLFGSILEFLNEDHGVFVVMTSNDISQLPPELSRSGRLDSVWYFGFPDIKEREEIFKIHFKKSKKDVSDKILNYAASITNNFTGAEIEQCVLNSIRKAFFRQLKDDNKNITEEDIKAGSSEIIPIIKSSKEKMVALYNYAKNRARFSNKDNSQQQQNSNNVISLKDL